MPAELITVPQEFPAHPESLPAVMITLPFNPKMTDKRMIEQSLNQLFERARADMDGHYQKNHVAKVFQRLSRIAKHLEYSTHKISLAILVSPEFEKVYYFDFQLEEQVTVSQQFNFRELAGKKAASNKFLIVTINDSRSRICLSDSNELTPLVLGHPYDNFKFSKSIGSEKLAQQRLDSFMLKTDQSLEIILAAYPYPILLMGSKLSVERFRKISKHVLNITETVVGDFDDSSPSQILAELKKIRIDTSTLRDKYNLNRLQGAAADKKLSLGIHECINAANARNARLLVVEKGFAITTFISPQSQLNEIKGLNDEILPVKDLVESTIEKVLQAGGEVEFVEEGLLADYMHIALIRTH